MGRGFGISAVVPADVVRELARAAEADGYSSFWVNDLPHAEGLPALAAAAEVTSRITLGIGVIPLDQHAPDAIAARLESLRVPQDRLILGVGSGLSRPPLTIVRSGVDALRDLVACPLVVGALGPKMAALGGEIADGVLFNWQTPTYAERAGQLLVDQGRDVLRLAYVRCGLMPDAEPRLRAELAIYEGLPAYQAHLTRMGVDGFDTYALGTDRESLQSAIAPYEPVLDETIVRAMTPDDSLDSLMTLLRAAAP